jgi:hypothetical protein
MGDTEKNGFISPDFVKSFTSELLDTDRSTGMSLFEDRNPWLVKQFDPSDVVTTTAGHFIVCDYNTHALHVLSEQGDILTCKVMEDTGIKYPISLSLCLLLSY